MRSLQNGFSQMVKRRLSAKMSWREFKQDHIDDDQWFHLERVKTVKAMRHFYKRVLKRDLEQLENLKIIVFAPRQSRFGEVLGKLNLKNTIVIYLSPELEKERQVDVDFYVAHEFAHVVLDYGAQAKKAKKSKVSSRIESQGLPAEEAADRLVAAWGFRIARTWNPRKMVYERKKAG